MLFLNIQNQKVKTWLRFQTVIGHEKAFWSLKMFKKTFNQIEKFLPFYQISCVEENVPF